MKKTFKTLYLLVLLLVFFSCQKTPETKGLKHGIYKIYPVSGTIFPNEISAPTVKWSTISRNNDLYRLFFTDQNGKQILTAKSTENTWRPNKAQWNRIKTASLESNIELTIFVYRDNEPVSHGKTIFSTSPDPVDGMLFYRNVPLPFSFANKNKELLSWHLADISKDKSKCVMTGIPVCANCHSFSADGSTLAMDVDYSNDKGNYAIVPIEKNTALIPEKIISWSDYKRDDGDFTFALLSQISPDGRYVLSTVKDRSIFVPVDNLEYSQLFFPFKGILAVYDRETNKFWSLPGADDPDYVQSNPTWSPDGKHILFTRSERYHDPEAEASTSAVIGTGIADEFLSGEQGFKYDIYKVPFNKGKGGTAEPLSGASNNDKSDYFPRYTPDGKWVVFCQADDFMLLQPSSKLYIVPAEGGEARLMNCNTSNMNSWHSFSPNGKWMVFASKENGPYTQLMLTHLDENGNDAPAVLLESLQAEKRAANIPEFVKIGYNDLDNISDDFSNTGNYYLRSATELFILDELSRAEELFDKAISNDPDNYNTHFMKVRMLSNISENELMELIDKINRHIKKQTRDYKAYLDRAEIYFKLKQYDHAKQDCKLVLTQFPDDQRALNLYASIHSQTGNKKDAMKLLNDAISKHPDNASAWSQRGLLFYNSRQFKEAIRDAKMAVSLDKNNYEYYINLGIYQAQGGELDIAHNALDKALRLKPDFYYALFIKAMIHGQRSEYGQAKDYLTEAQISLDKFIENNPLQKPIITRSMITSELNRFK